MRKLPVVLAFLLMALGSGATSDAQTANGSLDFIARITPTAARPEPVRQFTFYILKKSYTRISEDVESTDPVPTREKFIEQMKVSPELRAWIKDHDIMDLTMPGVDRSISPDDIIHVPEFLLAYQRSNSGGVTSGLPKPRYADADKTDHPEKYEKQVQEYLVSLKKFIVTHPATAAGIELELDSVNPQRAWNKIQSDHRKHVTRLAPDVAQTKYLAAKTDTDLEGHGNVAGLPPGEYWISTLSLEAAAGDIRLRWDVPFTVEAGQTARVELTNLNAADSRGGTP